MKEAAMPWGKCLSLYLERCPARIHRILSWVADAAMFVSFAVQAGSSDIDCRQIEPELYRTQAISIDH